MQLVVAVYRHTGEFPNREIYGLTGQLRRAAVSIPSNIAEGKGRTSDGERRLFFGYARGSLLELETQLLIAQHLGYLTAPATDTLLQASATLGRMLNALIQSLKTPAKAA